MTSPADLAAAKEWLQRSADSKSPSVAQVHAGTLLAALAELERQAAERDEAVEIATGLVVRVNDACARAEAALAEVERLTAERQRLIDENDKGVRALWDEKNKFMEALEAETAEKKALLARAQQLEAALREARDWIAEEDPGESDTGGFHASLMSRLDAVLAAGPYKEPTP